MRQRSLIAIAIIVTTVLVLVAIVYWLFFRGGPQTEPAANQPEPLGSNLPEAAIVSNVEIENGQPQVDDQAPAASDTERQSASFSLVARNFVERFGTYSNQADANGLADLKLMATDKLAAWLDEQYEQRTKNRGQGYYAVTSRVIALRPLSGSEADDKAAVLAEVQQTELMPDGQTKVGAKSVKVDLIKVNGQWLVDGAYWQ